MARTAAITFQRLELQCYLQGSYPSLTCQVPGVKCLCRKKPTCMSDRNPGFAICRRMPEEMLHDPGLGTCLGQQKRNALLPWPASNQLPHSGIPNALQWLHQVGVTLGNSNYRLENPPQCSLRSLGRPLKPLARWNSSFRMLPARLGIGPSQRGTFTATHSPEPCSSQI